MMNILRKTLILPILVLISGCGTKEQESERKDSISLTSSEVTIDHAAQTLEITVSSSESWTIGPFDLNEMVDELEEMLEESQELNFKRWDILDQMVHENYQALGSYSKEVSTVRNYITKRLESLDNLIQK